MNKTINFNKGGVQLFFTDEGFYTGSNIIGNPSAEDWEKINSVIDLCMSVAKLQVKVCSIKLQGPGY